MDRDRLQSAAGDSRVVRLKIRFFATVAAATGHRRPGCTTDGWRQAVHDGLFAIRGLADDPAFDRPA